MQKFLIVLFCCFVISGCATTQQKVFIPPTPQEIISHPKTVKEDDKKEGFLIGEVGEVLPVEGALPPLGLVFARTEFDGVLNAEYVKLFVESLDEKDYKFQLHIGEKLGQQDAPWEIKNVKPGFFFLELSEGAYKISSVSIPVGSTLATEESQIYFNVLSDAVVYLGALKMVGTKEKIKLGGLPVIKPGFEYKIQITDETPEAKSIFMKNFPENKKKIITQLMRVNKKMGEMK